MIDVLFMAVFLWPPAYFVLTVLRTWFAPKKREAVENAPDPVDHAIDTAAEVARPDSRIAARWADQPVIDAVFAEMVAVHRAQVHNHTDKEN